MHESTLPDSLILRVPRCGHQLAAWVLASRALGAARGFDVKSDRSGLRGRDAARMERPVAPLFARVFAFPQSTLTSIVLFALGNDQWVMLITIFHEIGEQSIEPFLLAFSENGIAHALCIE